jgi:hypothetical protein
MRCLIDTTKAIRKGRDNLLSIEGKNKRWYFRINGTTVYFVRAEVMVTGMVGGLKALKRLR